jgi:hypothetical protein
MRPGVNWRRQLVHDSSVPGCYEYGEIERLNSRSPSPGKIFKNLSAMTAFGPERPELHGFSVWRGYEPD